MTQQFEERRNFLKSAAVLGAATLLTGIGVAPASPAAEASAGSEPFTAARLAALRAEGRPVFVNMTAAWCVTCLVNERVALSTPEVKTAFQTQGITYLKGDWTREDPKITAVLKAHGRSGVPLYLYYAPGAAEPQVLPQLLTPGLVIEAVSSNPAPRS